MAGTRAIPRRGKAVAHKYSQKIMKSALHCKTLNEVIRFRVLRGGLTWSDVKPTLMNFTAISNMVIVDYNNNL